MKTILSLLASCESIFINLMRIAIFIVMAWIGALKAFQYEADGIVPFVANSPLMRFFYKDPGDYKKHINKEGQMVPANIEFHKHNGTYLFSYALGTAICLIGLVTLSGIWFPSTGVLGGLLTSIMSLVTLSFLITTPEAFVPNLGGPDYGFPYLSGAGRLVIKDVIMLAGGLIVAADSARQLLEQSH